MSFEGVTAVSLFFWENKDVSRCSGGRTLMSRQHNRTGSWDVGR